jgi:D-tyrosyl-tRNA(Tyr) deacylase
MNDPRGAQRGEGHKHSKAINGQGPEVKQYRIHAQAVPYQKHPANSRAAVLLPPLQFSVNKISVRDSWRKKKKSVRAVIQRVSQARVLIGGHVVAQISDGLCLFVGIGHADQESNAERLANKIMNLRVFEDDHGKMNLSVIDVNGQILAVSQFTLYGDLSRGHRPSFSATASPDRAERLYNCFVNCLRTSGLKVCTGQFKTHMEVTLTNDGPVTFTLED